MMQCNNQEATGNINTRVCITLNKDMVSSPHGFVIRCKHFNNHITHYQRFLHEQRKDTVTIVSDRIIEFAAIK